MLVLLVSLSALHALTVGPSASSEPTAPVSEPSSTTTYGMTWLRPANRWVSDLHVQPSAHTVTDALSDLRSDRRDSDGLSDTGAVIRTRCIVRRGGKAGRDLLHTRVRFLSYDGRTLTFLYLGTCMLQRHASQVSDLVPGLNSKL